MNYEKDNYQSERDFIENVKRASGEFLKRIANVDVDMAIKLHPKVEKLIDKISNEKDSNQ